MKIHDPESPNLQHQPPTSRVMCAEGHNRLNHTLNVGTCSSKLIVISQSSIQNNIYLLHY